MADFSNYEKQGVRPGRTVAYEVTELVNADGSHPVVHLEHLGRANTSLMQAMLARAGAEDAPKLADLDLVIEHGAKRLERVFFADGAAATDADIPAFVRAMPLRAFERMRDFAMDEANYCEFPIATPPQILAEK